MYGLDDGETISTERLEETLFDIVALDRFVATV
jgi:hypothetical protein